MFMYKLLHKPLFFINYDGKISESAANEHVMGSFTLI